jgi:hypothetical protein
MEVRMDKIMVSDGWTQNTISKLIKNKNSNSVASDLPIINIKTNRYNFYLYTFLSSY